MRELHAALKEAQGERGAGAGIERADRRCEREPGPGGRDGAISGTSVTNPPAGNEANAAIVAANVAKAVLLHLILSEPPPSSS